MPKYLIITGGSRGIGEKTITCFLKQGWNAVNLSRTPCHDSSAIHFQMDLSSPEQIEKQAKQLQEAVKGASQICLVHNAGYYKRDSIDAMSLTDIQRTLDVSVVAPSQLNKLFIPLMQPGSSILYIGSTLSEKAVPNAASYVISKHAIVGMMRSTCQDLNGKLFILRVFVLISRYTDVARNNG